MKTKASIRKAPGKERNLSLVKILQHGILQSIHWEEPEEHQRGPHAAAAEKSDSI